MRSRHDGFTPAKRRRFFAVLGKTGCISDAAKAARISTTTVDRWRRKDERFARLCSTALDRASSKIELLAWERAVTGIEEPVYHYGKFSHMRLKRSDSIFRMLLIAPSPRKYGRMGAVAQQQQPRVATNAEVRESLTKALKAYAARRRAEREARAEETRPKGTGELVELPDGRRVEPQEAQAMGYEVTPTGDPQAPYQVEFKGPPFAPGRRPDEAQGGAEAA